jgi:hypothetical protein
MRRRLAYRPAGRDVRDRRRSLQPEWCAECAAIAIEGSNREGHGMQVMTSHPHLRRSVAVQNRPGYEAGRYARILTTRVDLRELSLVPALRESSRVRLCGDITRAKSFGAQSGRRFNLSGRGFPISAISSGRSGISGSSRLATRANLIPSPCLGGTNVPCSRQREVIQGRIYEKPESDRWGSRPDARRGHKRVSTRGVNLVGLEKPFGLTAVHRQSTQYQYELHTQVSCANTGSGQ